MCLNLDVVRLAITVTSRANKYQALFELPPPPPEAGVAAGSVLETSATGGNENEFESLMPVLKYAS